MGVSKTIHMLKKAARVAWIPALAVSIASLALGAAHATVPRAAASPDQIVWQTIGTIPGSRPSIAFDASGQAHLALYGPEGPSGAEVLHVAEAGGEWTATRVDGPEDIGATTSIAVAGDALHVAYDYPRYGVRYAFPESDGTWKRIKVEASNPSGTEVALAVAAGGDPHIGFHSATNLDWRQGRWRASREDFNLRTNAIGDVGRHGAVAVGADDAYHVAYHDLTNSSVYYERDLPRRANMTVISPVDVVGRIALVLDRGDVPQLAFPTATGPVWARRDDAVWDLETELPGGEQAATHVAMALGPKENTHLVWEGPPGTYHYAIRDASNGDWGTVLTGGWPSGAAAGLAMASYDDRLLLAVDDRARNQVLVLEAAAGNPPTPLPPTNTPRPTARPTAGPTPTPAPADLRLWLSAGCDRSYRPGTILFARFSSTRSGRIVIDHAPPGERPLYDGPIVNGRPWAAALGILGEPGRRTIIATMPDFGLEARCRYDVAP